MTSAIKAGVLDEPIDLTGFPEPFARARCPTSMRRLALAALVLLAHGRPARAEVDPDVPHRITARLTGTQAVFTVRYEVPIESPVVGSVLPLVTLPPRGLVIAARVHHDGAYHPLRLRPADDAARQFEATWRGAGAGAPSAAVLLSSADDAVEVSVAWPRAGVLRLELDVAVPTCFFKDARHAPIPEAWVAPLRARPASAALRDACDDTSPTWFTLPGRARPGAHHLTVTSGRLALGADHVARVELGASTLSSIPRDLATVILVDGSRSMSDQQRQVQRQLVAAYARAAPGSQLQVISYARAARPLLPAWTPAAQAAPVLERALTGLTARNGSSVDVGLTEAAAWLARTRGTRRVIVITDELLANRLTAVPPAELARALPAGTLVHVVAVDATGRSLDRDDDGLLAPLAAARTGIALRIGQRQAGTSIEALRLVRPISLDNIAVDAPGWTTFDADTGLACEHESRTMRDAESVDEGAACTWWAAGGPAAGPVTLTGWLWGRRVTRVVQPDPAQALAVARELSTATVPEALRERVERAARAINQRWSLLATWGGTGGVTDTIQAGVGRIGGMSCCGVTDTVATDRATGRGAPPEDLRAQVRPVLAACGVDHDTLAIELEMTLTEIVDVRLTLTPAAAPPPAELARRRTCVEDALWEMTPALREVRTHQTVRVSLPPERGQTPVHK